MVTSKEKARAWRVAADVVESYAEALQRWSPPASQMLPTTGHMIDAVVPALRRRASIIERNAPKRGRARR